MLFYANDLSSFFTAIFFIICSVFILQRFIWMLSFHENDIFNNVIITLKLLSDK